MVLKDEKFQVSDRGGDPFGVRAFKGTNDPFLSGIAHDMRASLATVDMSAELLEQDVDVEASKHFITIIRRQAKRLQAMVCEMNNYLTVEGGCLTVDEDVFDLGTLVRETCEGISAVHKSHRCAVDTPSSEVRVCADYAKIQRILDNLVWNAISYAPSGSTIYVRSYFEDDASTAVLEVEDEGPGIPFHMRDQIFEPFVRLDQSRGQGLGLHIVKLLAEAHKGCVSVRATDVGGTCFRVSFPVQPSSWD